MCGVWVYVVYVMMGDICRWWFMKSRLTLIMVFIANLLGGCAWIDDVGTVDKEGSYTFTPSVEASAQDKGGDGVTNDTIACITEHDTGEFDIFDVQSIDDTIWQIILYDQVRQRETATILGITFAPWGVDAPSDACASPETLVGSEVAVTLDGCVRASLAVGTCQLQQTYQITGTLKLDAFSTTRRETVSGTLEGTLNLVRYIETSEGRTPSVTAIGSFTSSFTFPVHVGAPWYR